ncbi:MAG TPA: exonuclease domain-containing protein [Candidatus Dormibacteraeota bacterium]|nr:exonuclease domain-containing protein [Candidatus Dormibacteraeota bacterium]
MPRPSRLTALDRMDAVVLDTETTGLDVAQARIVQISAVRIAGGRVLADQTFDALVNPGVPIPPASTTVHGITDVMVGAAPPFLAVKADFDRFRGDAVLVGQSIGFDLAVLLRETRRLGQRWQPPRFLDTKLLAAALDPQAGELGLDALAEAMGVTISDRHRALGDALVTAEVFVRLLPRLAAAGVRTIGDAEARANAQSRIRARQVAEGWYDATSVEALDGVESSTDAATLARLDAIPYRHRIERVMRPAPIVPPATTIGDAIARLLEGDCGALLAGDAASGRADGIVTGRDLLRAVAAGGVAALTRKLETVMSEPVRSLPPDALLHRAMARMQRLGVRRLAVTDTSNRVVGLLSLRDLLAGPAADALALDDRLSAARSPRELAAARAGVPALVRALRADGVAASEIAAVISVDLRELLARAAAQAEKRMEGRGDGRPPVPYALLALARLGRGECLLAPEHAHAIVFASGGTNGAEAAWFAAFAGQLAEVLDEAGALGEPSAPRAAEPAWRRSLEDWRSELSAWASAAPADPAAAAALLDFTFVYGDGELADELRDIAVAIAGAPLVRALIPAPPSPLRHRGDGSPASPSARLDLGPALGAFEAAGRALAVASHLATRPTAKRLAEAASLTGMSRASLDELTAAHARLLELVLAQQDADLAAGVAPSLAIDPTRLDEAARAEVDALLTHALRLGDVVRGALALI